MTLSRDEIFTELQSTLVQMFELSPERVTLEANLADELDLDSIDAVDLMVKLQQFTGRKIKPDVFKSVRTVGDIVDCIHDMLTE